MSGFVKKFKKILHVFFAILIFLILGSLSTGLAIEIQDRKMTALQHDLRELARLPSEIMHVSFINLENWLISVRGLFENSENVSLRDFHGFVRPLLESGKNHPVTAMEWIRIRPSEKMIEYLGYPSTQGNHLIGVSDVFAADLQQAMKMAAAANEMIMTPTIEIYDIHNGSFEGSFAYFPVYETSAIDTPISDRETSSLGFIRAVVDWQKLVAPRFKKLRLGNLYIILDDITESENGDRIFSHGSKAPASTPVPWLARLSGWGLKKMVIIDTWKAGGRQWRLTVKTGAKFWNTRRDATATTVLILGWILAAGVGIFFYFLQTRYEQIETLVALRTHELKKISQSQAAILASAPYVIMTTNENIQIQTFNSAAEKILGKKAAEVSGKMTPFDFIPRDILMRKGFKETPDRNDMIAILKKLVEQPLETEKDWEFVDKSRKKIPVRISVTALQSEKGESQGFLLIAEDMTTKQYFEKIKNEFVSTVSHELRTPLTSIRGALGLVLGKMKSDISEKVTSLLEIAHKNCERLIFLTNDILDMEKIQSGKMDFHFEPILIESLLTNAVQANLSYAEAMNVGLKIDNQIGQQHIWGDLNRMMQVLANLISNAAKFSSAGGYVTVQAILLNPEHIRLNIIDNGTGIPEEFKNRIFEKFSQADGSDKRKITGTGLGLSIVKLIVENHHGQISFTSEAGQGTIFHVDLPIWKGGLA